MKIVVGEVVNGRVVVVGGVEDPGASNPNTCLEEAVTKFLGENNPLRGDLQSNNIH